MPAVVPEQYDNNSSHSVLNPWNIKVVALEYALK